MLDKDGFRLNVGIILTNKSGQLFWGRRARGNNTWQFPQGGVAPYETLEETMYRELTEEIGLTKNDIEIIATTKGWLRYKLPPHLRRYSQTPLCIGQKQKWYLLMLISNENHIKLDNSPKPEFDSWRWVDYWYPIKQVIYFKRDIYRKVLTEFESTIKNVNLPKH